MSTNPGATIFPVASIVSVALPSRGGSPGLRRCTSTIFPSLTPTSARNRSAPVPSTTVPPVIFRSNTITPSNVAPADMVVNVTPLQTIGAESGEVDRDAVDTNGQPGAHPARRCDRHAAATTHPGARGALLLGRVRTPGDTADVAEGVAGRVHRRPRRRTRRLLR